MRGDGGVWDVYESGVDRCSSKGGGRLSHAKAR